MAVPIPEHTTPECRQALAELFAYLDGEVDPAQRDGVAEHLDRCSDCLGAFEFHHELRQLIAHRCQADVPDELKGRIMAALAALDDPATGEPGSGPGSPPPTLAP